MTWQSAYEAAYLAANGHTAEVTHVGGGWYKIKSTNGQYTGCKYRRVQIMTMTNRLLIRASEIANDS